MRIAIELFVAAFLLLLMIAAAYLGILMNFLLLLLFACLAVGVVMRIVSLARKRTYLGIWKRSEYPQARPYLLQAILRSCFWVAVGLTVYFSVIPIQFSTSVWRAVMVQLWGVVVLLCFLELLPPKRIPWVANGVWVVIFLFLTVEFVKINLPPAPTKESVVATIPFFGDWYTFHGGNSCLINHHYFAGSQRFALDLILPEDGPLPLLGETDLAKYRTFGQTLLAPVDGQVVDLEGDMDDRPIGSMDPAHPAGNYVPIQSPSGYYVLLAHLQKGSLLVQQDQEVVAGQPIAKCGNSGNTSQPHLHIQAMLSPDLFSPTNRPLRIWFQSPGQATPRLYKRNDTIHGPAVVGDEG